MRSLNLRSAEAVGLDLKQFSTIQARPEVGRCGPSIQLMKMTHFNFGSQFWNLVAGLVGWGLHVQGYLVYKKTPLKKPDRICPLVLN